MERGASAYGSGSWESCRTRRCQMKMRGDRMEYLCATSTAGVMAVITVVGSHRAPRSPAGHMNVGCLASPALDQIAKVSPGTYASRTQPQPCKSALSTPCDLPPEGWGVAPMGAGWCRAGGVRGAAPVGLRTERAVFFGETPSWLELNRRERGQWVGERFQNLIASRAGWLSRKSKAAPNPLRRRCLSLRRMVSQARGGRLGY